LNWNVIVRFATGLTQALLALLYALLGWLTLNFLSLLHGNVSLVWPAAGVALVAVLLGGKKYALGVWLGAFAVNLLTGNALLVAAAVALGCALGALLGCWLLNRRAPFHADLNHPADYLRLAGAGAMGAALSAGVGVLTLWLAGAIPTGALPMALLNWWQGDTLGVFLLAPLLLIWRKWPPGPRLSAARQLELALLGGLLLLTGQMVFLGWFKLEVAPFARAYLLFVLVTWAAARFGRHGASLAIVVVALQALLGLAGQAALFGTAHEPSQMINFWLYTMTLAGVGMTVALLLNQRQQAQSVARASTEQLQAMTAAVPGVVFQLLRSAAGDWQFVYLSQSVSQLFGVSAEAARADYHCISALILPDDRADHRRSVERAVQGLTLWEHEYRITTPSGQRKWVSARATPELQGDGSIRWSGIMSDITAQHQAQDALRLAASVFNHTQESIVITDAQRNIIDANQAFTRASGYSRDEVLGHSPSLLKSGHHQADFYRALWQVVESNGFWTGEIWNRHKGGEVYAALLNISAVRDSAGQVTHYVGVSAEITLILARQQQIERIAHFDALTGVPNRVLLADRLAQAMAQTRREQQLLAVCYLDLDGFKSVNDSLGHAVGDLVLVEVVQRINRCIRAGDTLARVGGDEFVILLPGLHQAHEFQALLDRLLLEIALPMPAVQARCMGASIGVSVFPQHSGDADTLLHLADLAMYAAKRAGKSCYRLFGDEGAGMGGIAPPQPVLLT